MEDDQPATCVNCNQNHPASYRKCPKHVEYVSKIQKAKCKQAQQHKGNLQKRERQPLTAFPKLTSNDDDNRQITSPVLTYSQVVKSQSPSGAESNLSFIRNEIDSLFQCDISVLMSKIKSFIPVYRSQTDTTLKQIMIIDFLAQVV